MCAPVRELRPFARLCVDKKKDTVFPRKSGARIFVDPAFLLGGKKKGGAASPLCPHLPHRLDRRGGVAVAPSLVRVRVRVSPDDGRVKKKKGKERRSRRVGPNWVLRVVVAVVLPCAGETAAEG